MLCTRLLCNLGYRSCSTFSSVLTLGKKSQLTDAKSNQTAESDQDVQILPNTDLKKNNEQLRQADFASSSNNWDRGLSRSAQHGTHEASDENSDVNNAKKYNRGNTGKWRTGADSRDQGGFDRAGGDKWRQQSRDQGGFDRAGRDKWNQRDQGGFDRAGGDKWRQQSRDQGGFDRAGRDNWNQRDQGDFDRVGGDKWRQQSRDQGGFDRAGRDKWNQRDQGGFDRAGGDNWRQHSKSRRVEKDSGKWDSRSTSWNKPDKDWETDENQWHSLSKTSNKTSGQYQRPSYKAHQSDHHQSKWAQNPNKPQHKRHHLDQPLSPSQSNPDRSNEKPRGKRLRKKEKLGFIESEPAQDTPDAEQLLYGLHPVSLALTSGRRQVLRVYHRADAGAAAGRLSRLLAECAARGVGTVPLPAAQLDRIAAGTGVHQGVCARVTPLIPRPIDELLAQAGCPPLASGQPLTAEGEDQQTATPGAGAVEADVTKSEAVSVTPGTANTDRRLPVSAASEEKSPETGPPGGTTTDAEERAEAGAPEVAAAVSERPAHRRRVWLMLDQVHDPMNFGSIIRSSYFLGVDAVIIPDKNSCPLSPTVSKASAGTLEVFPVYSVPADSCRQLLQLLASQQWQLLAAGTAADGVGQSAGAISADTDTLLVVGNEGRGVDPSLASLCRSWTVPSQRHLVDGVESLNVGVAAGILLSQLILAR